MAVQADAPPQNDDPTTPVQPAGAEAPLDPLATRQLFLHRRIVTINPQRIEIRPPKSTMLLPAIGIIVMSTLLAAVVVWIDSLPFLLLPLVLLASVVILPLSGITLVYAIFGANIVADRQGQNVSVKQRFLGLGVGTTELIPFWKIREFVVQDVARAQPHAHGLEPAHDIAQWDLTLVKKSGKRIPLGGYNVPREHEEVGLDIVMGVGEAFAALSGAPLSGPIW
ncbi:MAG: hypothetical protein DK306_002445 [Chloroflexi bacterium]|nr:MAG: hypothetical protein DK306_002445 [Chloroflexota bacterium]